MGVGTDHNSATPVGIHLVGIDLRVVLQDLSSKVVVRAFHDQETRTLSAEPLHSVALIWTGAMRREQKFELRHCPESILIDI